MPCVSVIIPTHNRCELLKRAVGSVLCQTFSDWELIIVDDASTDETCEYLNGLDHPQIKSVILEENKGVSHARNRGRELATGEWIALLDSDDEWLKDRLKKQLEFAQENPDTPLIHGEEIWIRKGKRVNQKKIHQKSGGRILPRAFHLCLISPSATLMTAKLYDEMGGFREDYPVCEDYEMWLKVCCRYDVGFISEPIIRKYGGHEDQLSSRFRAMDFWRIKALDELYKKHRNFLSVEECKELKEVLLKKALILKQGYLKHNNLENLALIEALVKKYQNECLLQENK